MADDKKKQPRIWPSLPTKRSQMLESLFTMWPIWLAFVGIIVAVLSPVVRGCMEKA